MTGRQRQHRQAGFTLTELMMVVVLLGVVGSLGGLRLERRSHGQAVLGLAREIASRVAEARFLSSSSGCQAQLVIEPASARVIAAVHLATVPGMAPPAPQFGPASDEVFRRDNAQIGALASGTDLGGDPPRGPATADTLIFFPDGSVRLESSGAGQLGATLYLQDDQGGHPQRIAIFGRTGFAKVLAQ